MNGPRSIASVGAFWERPQRSGRVSGHGSLQFLGQGRDAKKSEKLCVEILTVPFEMCTVVAIGPARIRRLFDNGKRRRGPTGVKLPPWPETSVPSGYACPCIIMHGRFGLGINASLAANGICGEQESENAAQKIGKLCTVQAKVPVPYFRRRRANEKNRG